MKFILMILMVSLLLLGCGKQETMETVTDTHVASVEPKQQQIILQLPQELAEPALKSEETGMLYLCDEYSVTVQTVSGGDLAKTIRNATGMEKENLQIMQTQQSNAVRYQWVWSANGESGIQVGRGCVLDDGTYHYVLTAMADAEKAGAVNGIWTEMFASFHLADTENVNIGS